MVKQMELNKHHRADREEVSRFSETKKKIQIGENIATDTK